jgi:SAM-dependent methyltransferase
MDLIEKILEYHELNITSLFLEYFDKNYSTLNIQMDKCISLDDNIKLLCKQRGSSFIEIINQALQYAYDIKYGNWDEVNDLRKIFGLNWCKSIRPYFENIDVSKSLIDIGCNDGRELRDILGDDFNKPQITLIDISRRAIDKLQRSFIHRHIEVINESFLSSNFRKNSFDYCISLRTLHSSGINIKESVEKCFFITKPKGLIILSVSNGYIDNEKNEAIKGMYDYSTGIVDEEKPFQIALIIKQLLMTLGSSDINIIDSDSEIFVIGYKK